MSLSQNALHALEYQGRGWSVIPLRYLGGVDDLKRPLLGSWDQYKTKPASREEITGWWTAHPNANIGLVMGAVSGLVALDLDGPHARDLLEARVGALPPTLMVRTGKGYHMIFRHPGFPVKNRVRLIEGPLSAVDVRGDGGYIVAPPSMHGNGSRYQWVGEQTLPVPSSLMNLLRDGDTSPGLIIRGDSSWVDDAMRGVDHGQRNAMAAKLAGYWLRITDSEKGAWQILKDWNARNQPPMTERELNVTFSSIASTYAKNKAASGEEERPTVYGGKEWADEMRDTPARDGVQIDVPGFRALGGLVRGDLIVLGGRPRMGKSTFACQVAAEAACNHKLPTLVVSSEMTRQQWGMWMLSSMNGIQVDDFVRPIPDAILRPLREAPIFITDRGSISIGQIRREAERIQGLRLVVVDHINRISTKERDLRYMEVGDVARGLKSIAKDFECTVLALCHINRECEMRRPRLSDLRESGDIEQEADSVLFLWVPSGIMQKDIIHPCIVIDKNRHGVMEDIPVVFDKPRKRFRWGTDGATENQGDQDQGGPAGKAEALPGDVPMRTDDGLPGIGVAGTPEPML